MKLSLIIMRLEGVLALTGDVYHQAMNAALAEAGFSHRIDRANFAHTFGHDVGRESFLAYAARHLYPRKQTSDLRTLFEVTYKRLRQTAQEDCATTAAGAAPGVAALLHAAREHNVRLALVTALPLPVAQHLLASACGPEAHAMFDCIIKQDQGAPAAAFTQARNAVEGAAIALESTTAGLAAAEAAGVTSVAVIGQSVLGNGIHGARAVVDKLSDLADDEAPEARDPEGRAVLMALDAIVSREGVLVGRMNAREMRVLDVLREKGDAVKSVNPTDTVQFLAERLFSEKVGAMVVIADTGVLEGIVSERDLACGLAAYGDRLLAMPVSAIMTRAVITCAPVDSLHTVAKVMTARRIRHLPVSDGGKLVGLISIGDVLNRRLEEVQFQANVLRRNAAQQNSESTSAG